MNVKMTHFFPNSKPRGERPLAISISQQRSVGVRVEVETLYGGDGGAATVEEPYGRRLVSRFAKDRRSLMRRGSFDESYSAVVRCK